MTNKELAIIVNEIMAKEAITLEALAEKAQVNRPNLNNSIRMAGIKKMRGDVVNKIKKAFPAYFEQRTVKTNENEHKSLEVQRLESEVEFYRTQLLISLDAVYKNVSYSRAEIRGSLEYQAMKDARGNEKKRKEIMEQINKLIALNLTEGDGVYSHSS